MALEELQGHTRTKTIADGHGGEARRVVTRQLLAFSRREPRARKRCSWRTSSAAWKRCCGA